jgi:hypothetical protein
MTAPAVATTAGRIIVTTGTNSVTERAVTTSTVAAAETTTSTTFTNLTTVGPVVTVTTGTNAVAIISSQVSGSVTGAFVAAGVAVSGATTIAATDADAIMWQPSGSSGLRVSVVAHFAGTLTAGSNTFTMQYRASAGTGTFTNRRCTVFAL